MLPHISFAKKTIPDASRRKLANLILRIGVHSSTLMPLRVSLFFLGIGTLQHMSVSKGIEKWNECFTEGMKKAVCFWPLVMIGLYSVVPVRFGNLYMDSFNLVFMTMLSFIANTSNSGSNLSKNSHFLMR